MFSFFFLLFLFLPLFSFWVFPTELRAQMLRLLSSEVVLDSFFFFFPVIMIFIIISLPGQMIWKVLCCIFCVSLAFWMWEATWYQWGCAGGKSWTLQLPWKLVVCVLFFVCLFPQRQRSFIFPCSLYLAALLPPICILRAPCLLPPWDAPMPLKLIQVTMLHLLSSVVLYVCRLVS